MDKLDEQKERAREIIVRLNNLDNAKRPGGGVHGQVIGMEPYVIRTTGEGLQCLSDAQSLLDELLDPFGRHAAPPPPESGELAKLREAYCLYMACPTVRNHEALMDATAVFCDPAALPQDLAKEGK